jgi:serine/threonine-protein kinase
MDADRALRLIGDVLSGLSALHRVGLVHRDIQPSNVMVDLDDNAVLLDLGIALHSRRKPLTPYGMAIGTPGYMAPEQRGGEVRGRTDLFQVGLLMVYLMTGIDLDTSHGEIDFSQIANLPPAIAEIARRALSDFDQRFSSASEMSSAISRVLASANFVEK